MAETTPRLIWFNGEVVPWEQATVHVWTELAVRGANVFDGLRAYWHGPEARHYVLSLDEHIARLLQSAKLMKFPPDWDSQLLRGAMFELIEALDLRAHLFVRPTIYIESGRYGFRSADTVTGAYIVVVPLPRPATCYRGAKCCVSSWKRASDLTASPRVKAGAFYQVYRLARIEAVERGVDDIIFLNERGMVAESASASIFVIRGGQVSTPPITADILESVTRQKLIELLRGEFGTQVVEREINRTELYIADEVILAGTLSEIQPVLEIDNYRIGSGSPGPLTVALRDRYFQICESGPAAPAGWLTPVQSSSSPGRGYQAAGEELGALS